MSLLLVEIKGSRIRDKSTSEYEPYHAKGTTINDVGGGAEEIEKKKISEALLQEKINLKRPSPGKNWLFFFIPIIFDKNFAKVSPFIC